MFTLGNRETSVKGRPLFFFANSDLNIDTPHPEWRKAKPAPL